MFVPNRRVRISDDAAEQIRERVEEWGLKPGDRLPPERELATRLGVGRTSVREGLRALELSGFVDVIPSKGVFLKEDPGGKLERTLSAWLTADRGGQLELIELRTALEGQAVALAAERATPVELATIERGLPALRSAVAGGDPAATVSADASFHDAIARASRNGLLRRVLATIGADISVQVHAQTESGLTGEVGKRMLADHEAITTAMKGRDSATARAVMERHVSQVAVDLGIAAASAGEP
jgi:GntR family transcriptional regulator, transcriptional repressor for pyruvate dehydrogenase complex